MLSLNRIKTITLSEPLLPSYCHSRLPTLYRGRFSHPLALEELVITGCRGYLFRSDAALDHLQLFLLSAFNPRSLIVSASTGGPPVSVGLFRHFQRGLVPAWQSLERVQLKSVMLDSGLSSASFGSAGLDLPQYPPWDLIVELTSIPSSTTRAAAPGVWLGQIRALLKRAVSSTSTDTDVPLPILSVIFKNHWDRVKAIHHLSRWVVSRYGLAEATRRTRHVRLYIKGQDTFACEFEHTSGFGLSWSSIFTDTVIHRPLKHPLVNPLYRHLPHRDHRRTAVHSQKQNKKYLLNPHRTINTHTYQSE